MNTTDQDYSYRWCRKLILALIVVVLSKRALQVPKTRSGTRTYQWIRLTTTRIVLPQYRYEHLLFCCSVTTVIVAGTTTLQYLPQYRYTVYLPTSLQAQLHISKIEARPRIAERYSYHLKWIRLTKTNRTGTASLLRCDWSLLPVRL
jgi:hypothetical protein